MLFLTNFLYSNDRQCSKFESSLKNDEHNVNIIGAIALLITKITITAKIGDCKWIK